jgi:hypothetical protein
MPPVFRVPARYPASGGARETATAPPRRRYAAMTRTRPGGPVTDLLPHRRRSSASVLGAAVMTGVPAFRAGRWAQSAARAALEGRTARTGRPNRTGRKMLHQPLHQRGTKIPAHRRQGVQAENSRRTLAGELPVGGSRAGIASKATTYRSRRSSTVNLSAARSAGAPRPCSTQPDRQERA